MFISKLNKHTNNKHNDEPEKQFYFVLPFTEKNNNSFINLKINNFIVKPAYRNLNQLSKFIKTHKDTVDTKKQKNVVYRIECQQCDASYVEQTKRQLSTRIKEHFNYVKNGQTDKSVLA